VFWNNEDVYPAQLDGENESLQTDILRFMAIIGFCLMAVFALVQAIPVTNPVKNAVIENLSHDPSLLEEDLDHLKSDNRKLIKDLNSMIKYEGIARSRQKELDQAREDLFVQKEKLDRLSTEKIMRQEDMFHYKKLLSKREEEIRALKAAKERVNKIMEKTIEEPLPGPEKRPAHEYKEAAKEKGLYVAFSSDRVFLELLGSGKISMFITVTGMEQGFQATKKGGRIDFKTASPGIGLDLWEVKENMVPFEILEAFKAWTTLSSRKKILIVGLTPEISRQIRGKKVSEGRFIINSGGRVVYSLHGE